MNNINENKNEEKVMNYMKEEYIKNFVNLS